MSSDFITKDSGSKDTFATGYQRDASAGKGAYELLPFFALDRDAKLYERGAAKYGKDNWTKGAPFSRTLQSALRHLCQYMRGDRAEDHLAACRWGLAAVMHYEEMIARGLLPKELDDLPRYGAPKPAPLEDVAEGGPINITTGGTVRLFPGESVPMRDPLRDLMAVCPSSLTRTYTPERRPSRWSNFFYWLGDLFP